jgi:hypothetical protein
MYVVSISGLSPPQSTTNTKCTEVGFVSKSHLGIEFHVRYRTSRLRYTFCFDVGIVATTDHKCKVYRGQIVSKAHIGIEFHVRYRTSRLRYTFRFDVGIVTTADHTSGSVSKPRFDVKLHIRYRKLSLGFALCFDVGIVSSRDPASDQARPPWKLRPTPVGWQCWLQSVSKDSSTLFTFLQA